jgi:sec-independent protein translocase protein TatA
MPGSIGPGELIIVLVIALIVLGPKRLPEVGRSVGKGMREFKDAVSGMNPLDNDDDDDEIEVDRKPVRERAGTAD